jgi:hypothetical protein
MIEGKKSTTAKYRCANEGWNLLALKKAKRVVTQSLAPKGCLNDGQPTCHCGPGLHCKLSGLVLCKARTESGTFFEDEERLFEALTRGEGRP